jgi:hypothetical protein
VFVRLRVLLLLLEQLKMVLMMNLSFGVMAGGPTALLLHCSLGHCSLG